MKSKPSLATSKPPRLRVGLQDVDEATFSVALREKVGKQRVSIMLDASSGKTEKAAEMTLEH